jgi:hypothetical protein
MPSETRRGDERGQQRLRKRQAILWGDAGKPGDRQNVYLQSRRNAETFCNSHLVSSRDEYGEDFAKGYRSDAKLGTVLEREGLDDLSQLLKKKRR